MRRRLKIGTRQTMRTATDRNRLLMGIMLNARRAMFLPVNSLSSCRSRTHPWIKLRVYHLELGPISGGQATSTSGVFMIRVGGRLRAVLVRR